MIPSFRPFVIAALAVLLAACETTPDVRSFQDPSADLSRYATYGLHPNAAAAAQASFVGKYLQAAIDREMQARGYRRAEQPDLLVNFHLLAQEKLDINTTPAGYYGWRAGYRWAAVPAQTTEVRSYTEGTLNIDVVDRARNELLWEGVGVGRIKQKSLKEPEPAINAAVAQIFQKFPGRAAGP